MRACAVISLYNPTTEQIENINRIAGWFDKTIVVDDSEEDHTTLFINNSNLTMLWNGQNLGLTKTVNKGIDVALKNGAEWVVVLDQDCEFNKSILDVYDKYLKDNDTSSIAILCPQLNYDRHKRKVKNGYKEVNFCVLSGSMINMKVYRELGGYDERFFMDGLDIEWCLRATSRGYKIIMCMQAVLNHQPAITRSVRVFDKDIFRYGWDSHIRYYYQFKSFFMIHHLYHSFRHDLMFIYKVFKVVFLFENKKLYIKALIDARRDYKNGFYGKYVG